MVISKKLVITVSLCAMLAVNPVLATDPSETSATDDTVGTSHEIYVESTLPSVDGYQTAGIAGVSYVNRMVDAAGSAAQAAEDHAAAAGAYAIAAGEAADAAKESADSAASSLKYKVDIFQDEPDRVMVTNDAGNVYAGYLDLDMIKTDFEKDASGNAVFGSDVDTLYYGLGVDRQGNVTWGHLRDEAISGLVVSGGQIANGAVMAGNISGGAVTKDTIAAEGVELGTDVNATGHVLVSKGGVYDGMAWQQITSPLIANGAVTPAKMVGVDASGNYRSGIFVSDASGNVTVSAEVDGRFIADGSIYGANLKGVPGTGYGVIGFGAGGDFVNYGTGSSGEVMLIKKDYEQGGGYVSWGQITPEYTDGIVGVVPVGSASSYEYANFWIE